jgi:NAD(P)-dependent dehydrogenase (short-subunit alcohol dehydrogenase family)
LWDRGLGEFISLKFAREGANVAINYVSSGDVAKKLAEKCEKEGVKAVVIQGVGSAISPTPWFRV